MTFSQDFECLRYWLLARSREARDQGGGWNPKQAPRHLGWFLVGKLCAESSDASATQMTNKRFSITNLVLGRIFLKLKSHVFKKPFTSCD